MLEGSVMKKIKPFPADTFIGFSPLDRLIPFVLERGKKMIVISNIRTRYCGTFKKSPFLKEFII